jgi:hypothetical protein
MKTIAFDIETYGNSEILTSDDIKYLQTRGGKERTEEEVLAELGFNPYALNIIAIALTTIEDDVIKKTAVHYISDGSEGTGFEDLPYDGSLVPVEYKPVILDPFEDNTVECERKILDAFWSGIEDADRIISFNGLEFDAPVIRLRCIINGLTVKKDILGQRYGKGNAFHLDIMDFLCNQNSFHKFNFDFTCRRLGIESPKKGLDGAKVGEAFKNKQYRDIATYNAMDTIALAQLYLRLGQYISTEKSNSASTPTQSQLNYLKSLLAKAACQTDQAFSSAMSSINAL